MTTLTAMTVADTCWGFFGQGVGSVGRIALTNMTSQPTVRGARAPPPTANEQIGLSCFDKAIKVEGTLAIVGDPPDERLIVGAAAWRDWFYMTGMPAETTDTKRKAFNRARELADQQAKDGGPG